MGTSIATQNILRELQSLEALENQTTRSRLEPYTAVTLNNSLAPGNTLEMEMLVPATPRVVSLEHIAAHRLHVGPDAHRLTLTVGRGDATYFTKELIVPHGSTEPSGFCAMLENRLNAALVENQGLVSQLTVPDIQFYRNRFPTGKVVEDNATLVRTDHPTHLPAAAIMRLVRSAAPTDVTFVYRHDPYTYAVARVPLSAVEAVVFAEDRPCLVIPSSFSVRTATNAPVWTYPAALAVTRDQLVNADGTLADVATWPPDKRGLCEFLYRVRPGDGDMAPELVCAFQRAVMQTSGTAAVAMFAFYDIGDGSPAVVRVTALEWAATDVPQPAMLQFLVYHDQAIPPPVYEPPAVAPLPPEEQPFSNRLMTHRFTVRSVSELVSVLTSQVSGDIVDPLDTDEAREPWALPDYAKIEPQAAQLFRIHTRIFPTALDAADRWSPHKLLQDIQKTPISFNELGHEGTFSIFLSPIGMKSFEPTAHYYTDALQGFASPWFRLTGPAARALTGAGACASVDPLGAVTLMQPIRGQPPMLPLNFAPTAMVQACLPQGMYNPTPSRLFVYLRVNNMRVQGQVYGQRPLAVVPTRRALDNLYEPRYPTWVGVPGTVTRVGVEIEDEHGSPVAGEYTVLLRMR